MALAVGDHVRMRHPDDARKTDNTTFEVMVMPIQQNMGATWWELKGDQDGLIYIVNMLTTFTVEPV